MCCSTLDVRLLQHPLACTWRWLSTCSTSAPRQQLSSHNILDPAARARTLVFHCSWSFLSRFASLREALRLLCSLFCFLICLLPCSVSARSALSLLRFVLVSAGPLVSVQHSSLLCFLRCSVFVSALPVSLLLLFESASATLLTRYPRPSAIVFLFNNIITIHMN